MDTSPGAQVFLDSFAVIVAAGQIDVAGAVRRVTPGPFGILTATWSATITLTLNAARQIDATVSEPAVQLNEWYAVVGNFVTGGKIADTVASIVHDQLTGGLTGTGIDTLITAAVGLVSSSGTTAVVPIDVRATQVEVRPDAVVVHGTVTPVGTPEPPRAALTAIQGVDPGRLTFDAGGSWVPGGEITAVEFDFGDGSSQTFAGTNVALVTDHPYTAGLYNACVSITDQAGRTTRTCVAVQPGSLVIELRDAPNWEFCSSAPTLTFDVTSSGSAIGGAIVTLAGNGWALTAATDAHGTAQITVDPNQVRSHGAAGAPPSPFHLGAVSVSVSKPGWLGRQTIMWMVDCDSMIEAKLASIAYRNEVLDRLAGYSALKDLLDKYPPGQRDPGFPNPFTQPPAPKPTPKDVAHLQLDHAVDLLTRLEDLITDGSDVLPVTAILGIDPEDPEASAQMRQRMGELWQGVGMAAGRYDDRYGPNGPRP